MFQYKEKDKMSFRILLMRVILVIAAEAIALSGAWGQVQTSSNTYAITSVAVVDVENGIILPDHTVIITDDRIERVAPQSEISVPEGAQLIDGKGLYLMPGLIDSHVHYFDQSTFGRMMIAHGVVSVRDMGNPNLLALGLREKLKKREILGPEMITTGSILDGDPPFIPSISIVCKTPEEGRAAVRLQAKAGVNQIKVYSRLGKVAEGKTASLVLVRANPLEDIHNASKIEGVFLRGRYFSRVDLDRLLKETRELCKR